jgi:hypothetical protein
MAPVVKARIWLGLACPRVGWRYPTEVSIMRLKIAVSVVRFRPWAPALHSQPSATLRKSKL